MDFLNGFFQRQIWILGADMTERYPKYCSEGWGHRVRRLSYGTQGSTRVFVFRLCAIKDLTKFAGAIHFAISPLIMSLLSKIVFQVKN